jgi:hypothetical protein
MPCFLPSVIRLLFHNAANNYKNIQRVYNTGTKNNHKTPSALEKNTQKQCLFLRTINKVLHHAIMFTHIQLYVLSI